jgi:hypothetical protein
MKPSKPAYNIRIGNSLAGSCINRLLFAIQHRFRLNILCGSFFILSTIKFLINSCTGGRNTEYQTIANTANVVRHPVGHPAIFRQNLYETHADRLPHIAAHLQTHIGTTQKLTCKRAAIPPTHS